MRKVNGAWRVQYACKGNRTRVSIASGLNKAGHTVWDGTRRGTCHVVTDQRRAVAQVWISTGVHHTAARGAERAEQV